MKVFANVADTPASRQRTLDYEKALAIGRGEGRSTDLVPLLASAWPLVRRAAAGAMKKRLLRDPSLAQAFALPLSFSLGKETAPQVLQYKLRALALCGECLPANCYEPVMNLAHDPSAPEYVRQEAAVCLASLEKSLRGREALHRHWCARCRQVIADVRQVEATVRKFGKAYCRHCQDELEFEAVAFNEQVEAGKHYEVPDGTWVQSQGELRIAAWLDRQHIAYEYDKRFRIVRERLLRPDFYLPEFDVYIEYWGMDTPEYLAKKEDKIFYYQKTRRRLISLDYRELDRIEEVLALKLSRYINLAGPVPDFAPRCAGARRDGDAGARRDGDAGARRDGDAGACRDGDAGARRDGDAGACRDGDAGACRDGDAGGCRDGDAGACRDGFLRNTKTGPDDPGAGR